MAARTWPVRAFMRANVGPGRPLPFAQHRSPYRGAAVPSTSSFVRSFAVSAVDRRSDNGGVPSTLHRQLVHADDRFPNTTRSRIIGGCTTRRMSSSSAAPQYFEGPWYEKYLLLEEYKEEHGNCLVPQRLVYNDVHLGIWVANQRKSYKKGKLSQDRREMLDALGFSWDPYGDQWERNFALLKRFKGREGHCKVPREHEEDGIRLGFWLNNQRQAFKKGKLDESYEKRLEQLGVSWDPLEDQWERNFALLEQFKEREGHCNVSDKHEEDGIKLGIWLDWQRQVRKGNRVGSLSLEQIQRLEKLGISWGPWEDKWECNFSLLEQFKEREGHCNVPQSHEEDGVKLGIWLSDLRLVRKGKRGGNLSQDRIDRLEKCGISWDPLADQWERNFALLKQFKVREGHCNVPSSHEEDGIKLGTWLDRQRQVRKGTMGGNLGVDRIARLDEIGIRW